MNCITTGLAKAKYNICHQQVEIIFDGLSTEENFQDNLEIIQEVGLINRARKWILNVNKLQGIKAKVQIRIIVSWMEKMQEKMITYGISQGCEICVVSEDLMRQLTVAIKKMNDQGLIPEWLIIRVAENASKIYYPQIPQVATAVDPTDFTLEESKLGG